jgi:hypothetical protein
MKKGLIPGLTLVAAFAFAAAPAFAAEDQQVVPDADVNVDERDPNVIPFEEAPSHIFLTREEADRAIYRGPLARRSANMTYHGGKIMPTAVSKAIFWGPSWTNATFAGDKISGLDSWYTGHSASNYAKTVDEYTGTNGQVGATTTHQGHVIDTSTATGGNNTSTILAEVCKQITAGNIVPDASGNGYYPVYTDVKRGSAGYCAWHSAGTCGGKAVQFAFFFNLDGDPGCDPADTTTGHSQGLAALANVTAHELSEARSDPASPGAWYDSSGAENGDKCAWTFNVPSVAFLNGTSWKLQGEWSNAAYTAGTGYPNSSGQRGCLNGH